jgi:GNAT superfamily N-acetyltransferase
MALTIRAAEVADTGALCRLIQQLTGEETTPEQAEAAIQCIQGNPACSLLVAAEDGEVVGSLYLVVAPNLTHAGRPWCVIENMIVDQARRRRGIGRALMNSALEIARDAGCYKMFLGSNVKRADAHEFYRALGFHVHGPVFRMDL